MKVGSATADTTIVAAGRKVSILWIKFSNTGTTSTAGIIEIEDAAGNTLFTYSVSATPLQASTGVDWDEQYDFSDRGDRPGLESPSGLVINYTTADEVLVEIGYE